MTQNTDAIQFTSEEYEAAAAAETQERVDNELAFLRARCANLRALVARLNVDNESLRAERDELKTERDGLIDPETDSE